MGTDLPYVSELPTVVCTFIYSSSHVGTKAANKLVWLMVRVPLWLVGGGFLMRLWLCYSVDTCSITNSTEKMTKYV